MSGNRAQRRLAAKRIPRDARAVFHAMIDIWLQETDVGRAILACGSSVQEARQIILELQENGLARVEVSGDDPLQVKVVIDRGLIETVISETVA